MAFLLLWCIGWQIAQSIHSRGTLVVVPDGEDTTYREWASFPSYKVFDEHWNEERLGESVWTIGGRGDFLCCVCSVMAAARGDESITPNKVNTLLNEMDGYDEDGNIKTGVLRKIAKNVRTHYFIDSELEDSGVSKDEFAYNLAYDIVKVKKEDEYRWIVIKGYSKDGKDYRCMDPREEKETVLSDYGSYVYDWYTVGKLREEVDLKKREIEKKPEGEIWFRGVTRGNWAIISLGILLFAIYEIL